VEKGRSIAAPPKGEGSLQGSEEEQAKARALLFGQRAR